MTDIVHLVATNEREYGWSLRSPQVPGLAYGRDTEEQLLAELEDVLAFAEAPDGPRQIHEETRHVSPEGVEYVVRVAADRHPDRADVAQRLHAAMTDPVQRANLLDLAGHNPGSEHLFIAVLGDDRIRWIHDQLDPHGEIASIIVAIDDVHIWHTRISRNLTRPDLVELDELGLGLDSTITEAHAAVGQTQRILTFA
jgi:predicted RNase H-like HicB family nuclease